MPTQHRACAFSCQTSLLSTGVVGSDELASTPFGATATANSERAKRVNGNMERPPRPVIVRPVTQVVATGGHRSGRQSVTFQVLANTPANGTSGDARTQKETQVSEYRYVMDVGVSVLRSVWHVSIKWNKFSLNY